LDQWEIRRARFLERIKRDLETGYFDVDILDLVKKINEYQDMYTTSSCSGRIILIRSSQPWKKDESSILGKWHNGVEIRELLELLKRYGKSSNIWLILQSPIVHVVCRNVELAVRLIRLARSCGFRYSSIISHSSYGYVAEIMSSERLDIPVVLNGSRIINDEKLEEVVNYLNERLRNSKKRIERLRSTLDSLGRSKLSQKP